MPPFASSLGALLYSELQLPKDLMRTLSSAARRPRPHAAPALAPQRRWVLGPVAGLALALGGCEIDADELARRAPPSSAVQLEGIRAWHHSLSRPISYAEAKRAHLDPERRKVRLTDATLSLLPQQTTLAAPIIDLSLSVRRAWGREGVEAWGPNWALEGEAFSLDLAAEVFTVEGVSAWIEDAP